ncbi:helix-turn-helix domain-containing protein [Nocardia suismassiliense]|uniref:helix-turn-helix domain-containing protein n=1 Tax=Nocardia suismassiliense TaxID=2077092 RepID=UPI00131F3939|nr:helix-turn-helix domain-containing protein [Nocardia suismassiliense]
MTGGAIDTGATEQLSRVLGAMIRELRTSRGIKQAQAAKLAGVSVSAYSKWEEGKRRPLQDNLERLCIALDCEEWLFRKMMSLTSESQFRIEIGTWPPRITDEDIEVIEELPFPALYRKLPEYDIIYSNEAMLKYFPMFAPAPLDSPQPANMIERMLTDYRARTIFVDWYTVAHRMVYMMRLWSRGVSPERHAEIMEACNRVPEFDFMWNNNPPAESFATNRLIARYPADNSVHYFTLRSWFPNYPPGEAEILAAPRSPSAQAQGKA